MARKEFELKSKSLQTVLDEGFSASALPPVSPSGKTTNSVHREAVRVGLASFTVDNAPEDYEGLKEEIRFLERVHAQSFLILAHRLKIIRDGALYLHDGYRDFKSFVEGEMEITRATAYNYIRILESVDVKSILHENYNLTSLIKAIPYLREYPSERDEILKLSGELSSRAFERELKVRYPRESAERAPKSQRISLSLSLFSDEALDDLVANIVEIKRERFPENLFWQEMERFLSGK